MERKGKSEIEEEEEQSRAERERESSEQWAGWLDERKRVSASGAHSRFISTVFELRRRRRRHRCLPAAAAAACVCASASDCYFSLTLQQQQQQQQQTITFVRPTESQFSALFEGVVVACRKGKAAKGVGAQVRAGGGCATVAAAAAYVIVVAAAAVCLGWGVLGVEFYASRRR